MTDPETESEPGDRRSWFPLALAGGFVVFALLVAAFAYLNNDTNEPEKARTVSDVARLAAEAVDLADAAFARQLSCPAGGATAYVGETSKVAEISDVEGDETGSFHLSVPDLGEFEFTVAQDGDRSCVAGFVRID